MSEQRLSSGPFTGALKPGDRATVVEEAVDGLLEHPLFSLFHDVSRRADVKDLLSVVPVDGPSVPVSLRSLVANGHRRAGPRPHVRGITVMQSRTMPMGEFNGVQNAETTSPPLAA